MRLLETLFIPALLCAGCGAGKSGDGGLPEDAGSPADLAGTCIGATDGDGGSSHPSMTLPIVTKQHLDQAHGSIEVPFHVPSGCWASIKVEMNVTSDCSGKPPAGQNWSAACDPYDRLAQVWINDLGKTPLFVLDAVTSFGGTTHWEQDVTDYLSAIEGDHTWHIEVGTYADPNGKATGTASSHDVDVNITLIPGIPPRKVLSALPLFRTGISDPKPLTATFAAPANATHGRLDYYMSGHGGNPDPKLGGAPCDEFCQRENDLKVDGKSVYADSPTSDCSDNCTQVPIKGMISCGNQSFGYICKQNPTSCPSSAVAPRSNWCPSQIIAPIAINLPASAITAGMHTIELQIPDVHGTWSIGLSAVFY